MKHEFPDELLSAYLDGELTADERSVVERHLAESQADRQLLGELQSLKRDLAALPQAKVDAGFADRVVEAALAAKASSSVVATRPVREPGAQRWSYAAAAIVAVAASLLLFAKPWQPEGVPTVHVLSELPGAANIESSLSPLVAALGGSVPADGEAVVLRLRLKPNESVAQAVDKALAAAGIQQRPASDVATGAMQLGAQYRQQLAASTATSTAVDALFVEAPLDKLEAALAALEGAIIAQEARLAFSPPAHDGESGASGESSERATKPADAGQPFAQRLNPGMFRLAERQSEAANSPLPTASIDPQSPLRLLILVEQAP
jgi:hypothetical protein